MESTLLTGTSNKLWISLSSRTFWVHWNSVFMEPMQYENRLARNIRHTCCMYLLCSQTCSINYWTSSQNTSWKLILLRIQDCNNRALSQGWVPYKCGCVTVRSHALVVSWTWKFWNLRPTYSSSGDGFIRQSSQWPESLRDTTNCPCSTPMMGSYIIIFHPI